MCQWHFLVRSMCEALAAKAANVEHIEKARSMRDFPRPAKMNQERQPGFLTDKLRRLDGVAGLEPANDRIKICWLTTCRHPNELELAPLF